VASVDEPTLGLFYAISQDACTSRRAQLPTEGSASRPMVVTGQNESSLYGRAGAARVESQCGGTLNAAASRPSCDGRLMSQLGDYPVIAAADGGLAVAWDERLRANGSSNAVAAK
jgi:hypothetical protein